MKFLLVFLGGGIGSVMRNGDMGLALIYVVVSVLAGLGAVWVGLKLALSA